MANATGARGRFEDYALLWGLIGVVALLAVLPLVRLLLEAVLPGGTFSADAVRRVLSSNATWTATGHSLVTALGGTALAVVLGGVVALVVSLTDIRGRNAFVFCYVMPLMLAPQVVALAWLQVFGPSSPFLKMLGMAPALGSRNPLYSPGGIILVLGVQYAPLVFLTLRAGLRTLPQELLEAAMAGGARPLRVVRTIVVPLMTPPILAGVALCFVSCLGNFGIPALLGIPGNYLVLPTLIYQRLAGFGPAVLSEVAVLSVLIGMIAIVGILTQDFMLGRRDFRTASASVEARPFELRRWRTPVEVTLWIVAFVALVLPLGALLLTSLVPRCRRAADGGERDARKLPLRAVRACGRSSRVSQQLRAVGVGRAGHRAARRAARLFPGLAAHAAAARGEHRHRRSRMRCPVSCWRSPRSSCS
jgi:iron(III) transport system permease protein